MLIMPGILWCTDYTNIFSCSCAALTITGFYCAICLTYRYFVIVNCAYLFLLAV